MADPADTDQAERDAPDDPRSLDLDLADDQRGAQGEQHDGQREASDAEGDREPLGDSPADRSEGSGFSEGAERPDHDEQENPQVAGVAFPDAGALGRLAASRLLYRLFLVSCLCHNHQTYR